MSAQAFFAELGLKTTTVMASINAGTPPAGPAGTIASFVGADGANSRVLVDSFGTGVSSIHAGRAARGTMAAPSAVQLGDEMANFSAWGYGATGYSAAPRGRLALFAGENWTDTAQGTRLGFFTTAPTTVTTTEKMRVWGDGGISVNTTFTTSPGASALSAAGRITAMEGIANNNAPSLFATSQRVEIGSNITITAQTAQSLFIGRDLVGSEGIAGSNVIIGKGITMPTSGSSTCTFIGQSFTISGTSSNMLVVAYGGTITAGSTAATIIGRPDQTGANCTIVGRTGKAAARSCSFGESADASGTEACAFGQASVAQGSQSTALGKSATCVAFTNSVALGYAATVTANNQIMLGRSSEFVSIPGTGVATSTTTGALRVGGGLGVVGSGFFGAPVSVTAPTTSISAVVAVSAKTSTSSATVGNLRGLYAEAITNAGGSPFATVGIELLATSASTNAVRDVIGINGTVSAGGTPNAVKATGIYMAVAGAAGTTLTQGIYTYVSGGVDRICGNFCGGPVVVSNKVIGAPTYTAPTGTKLQVLGDDGLDGVTLFAANGTGVAPILAGRRARGTDAFPTAVQLNDDLFSFASYGYGATGFSAATRAAVTIMAGENWTDAAQGTRIGFFTTAPTTVTTSEKLRIWGDGGMQLGGTFTASTGAGAFYASGAIRTDDAFLVGPDATIGSWRIKVSGTDLVIDRYEGGSWVTKTTVAA